MSDPDEEGGIDPIEGIDQAGPYQSIFKYVSLASKTSWNYLEEAIQNQKLYGSTTVSLNDPFELRPCVIDDLSEEIIRSCHDFGSVKTKPRTHEFDDLTYWRKRAAQTVQNTIDAARIIVFSDKIDSPLLWSHYANSHRGACLHFVARAFRAVKTQGWVRYSRQRPSLQMSAALRHRPENRGFLSDDEWRKLRGATLAPLAFTKPVEWEYEGEFRVVYSATRKKHIVFEKCGLLEIILGAKISDEDAASVVALVENAAGVAPRVCRASLSARTFSVQIDPEAA